LLRHRLRRRATRRISRGRWRGRLSRWRRWRMRSLSGCRAGSHQSCQDQKKRFSLHGEQMLPRYRCSLPAENRLAYSVYRPSGFGFPPRPVPDSLSIPKRTSGAPGVVAGARPPRKIAIQASRVIWVTACWPGMAQPPEIVAGGSDGKNLDRGHSQPVFSGSRFRAARCSRMCSFPT
jgi:hypothetical protein